MTGLFQTSSQRSCHDQPLHVGTVSGQPLRFFKTPLDDGKPDLPWHAVDDLQRVLGLNREQRKFFLHKLRNRDVRTVATADGIITIAPHYMAQGTIDAMIEMGKAPASVRAEYDRVGSALQKLIPPPLEFGTDAWFGWMKAATHRWEDAA
jgi:hypothetical protein